jgi:phosphoenolpyruvate synthase/pyruvate phosphate dikinase
MTCEIRAGLWGQDLDGAPNGVAWLLNRDGSQGSTQDPHQYQGALTSAQTVVVEVRSNESGEADWLRGTPASGGQASGPARVIRRLDEFDRLLAGDVLVAPAITPAWTQLFGRAAAVVADTGGQGSNSSVVAREYGIPCVVGTRDATARLRDGQVVWWTAMQEW